MPAVPGQNAPNDAKRSAQAARARQYGIEALQGKGENLSFPTGNPTTLADYGDPVNLKFPLAPDARARNARARFKQFASTYSKPESRRVVHTRIVERLLSIGAAPSFDASDPLDKLLPPALQRRLQERKTMTTKAQMIEVTKVELQDGEELQKMVRAIIDTLRTDDGVLAVSKELGLRGVYKDHVIAQCFTTGKMFKFTLARGEDGSIELSNPVEVRMTFQPVEAAPAAGEGGVAKAEAEPAPKYVEAPKPDLWKGILH